MEIKLSKIDPKKFLKTSTNTNIGLNIFMNSTINAKKVASHSVINSTTQIEKLLTIAENAIRA